MKIKIDKILIVLFISVGLICLAFGNKSTIASTKLDLLTLSEILQKEENITIHEWSLHAREKLENVKSVEDAKSYQEELKKAFPDGNWEEVKNHQSTKFIMNFSSSEFSEESITITTSLTTNDPSSYIIYEVKGKKIGDKEMKRVNKVISEKISVIFRDKPAIFSCIKGEFSDKMNETLPYYVNELLNAFDAKTIEALVEDDFVSTSAYTHVLEEGMENNEKAMNLQLGLRTHGMGEKTTFVVGTPIITIEY